MYLPVYPLMYPSYKYLPTGITMTTTPRSIKENRGDSVRPRKYPRKYTPQLTETAYSYVLALHDLGVSAPIIAEMCGLNKRTVYRVIGNETYQRYRGSEYVTHMRKVAAHVLLPAIPAAERMRLGLLLPATPTTS